MVKVIKPTPQDESDRYHREYYASHQLFEPGTWLEKPNSALMNIGEELAKLCNVSVLDLGSGIGRNAIPLAQLLGKKVSTFDCVDIVEIAIEKLKENASYYRVDHIINPILKNLAEFSVASCRYDLILAMSSLEHAVKSEKLPELIRRIQNGTKITGFNCLSIGTNLTEIDHKTGKNITPLISAALSSAECTNLLRDLYRDWDIQKLGLSTFSQRIHRGQQEITWSSDYCLLVARRLG